MNYIFVQWNHNFEDEPVLLYSEIDELRFEVRKIEIFRDGKKGYASKAEVYGSTMLGIEPVPNLSELSKDPQFKPKEITRQEFENIWINRRNRSRK